MIAGQRRISPLVSPVGPHGVCSSPGFELILIGLLIPSLLLTVVVCGLLYLSIRSFRRGQIFLSSIALVAALLPFILFAKSTVQSILADHERARPLANLAKAGPVNSFPDVLVVRLGAGYFLESEAARLMLALGFREVDVIDKSSDGRRTLAIAPTAGCREALEAWAAADRYPHRYSSGGDNLDRCLTITKWGQQAPERDAAVILLQREFTTFDLGRRRLLDLAPSNPFQDLELRIKNGSQDVLLDYWLVPSDRPMFPLFVWHRGFFVQGMQGMELVPFVLRNLKPLHARVDLSKPWSRSNVPKSIHRPS